MSVLVRRRHPLLVAERYEACRAAGVPEEEAINWAYTRSVRVGTARLAEVASDWWLCGFGYAHAVGWIRLVGVDGSCAAQDWQARTFALEDVRVLMRKVFAPADRMAWRNSGIPGWRVREYVEAGVHPLEAVRREWALGRPAIGYDPLAYNGTPSD